MTLTRLSELIGVSVVNLSVLKNRRSRAIRCSILPAICRALECEIGDLLVRAHAEPRHPSPLDRFGRHGLRRSVRETRHP